MPPAEPPAAEGPWRSRAPGDPRAGTASGHPGSAGEPWSRDAPRDAPRDVPGAPGWARDMVPGFCLQDVEHC